MRAGTRLWWRSASELELLGRQQKEWSALKEILPGNITQAYLVQPGAADPQLKFKTRGRSVKELMGARISLAETVLAIDPSGAYRAEQTYRMNNSTEQFLDIELPEGARLWTAFVDGQPVKPTEVPGVAGDLAVRIPLLKTASGERDYKVVLKYGGSVPAISTLTRTSFPFIRSRNINVERSQVRLYVPQTHAWFDFGGTMRRASSEEDMAAGNVAADIKETQRLLDVFRHGDEFARARAENNLKQIGLGIQSWAGGESQAEQVSRVGDSFGFAARSSTSGKDGRQVEAKKVTREEQEVLREAQKAMKEHEQTADKSGGEVRQSQATQRSVRGPGEFHRSQCRG